MVSIGRWRWTKKRTKCGLCNQHLGTWCSWHGMATSIDHRYFFLHDSSHCTASISLFIARQYLLPEHGRIRNRYKLRVSEWLIVTYGWELYGLNWRVDKLGCQSRPRVRFFLCRPYYRRHVDTCSWYEKVLARRNSVDIKFSYTRCEFSSFHLYTVIWIRFFRLDWQSRVTQSESLSTSLLSRISMKTIFLLIDIAHRGISLGTCMTKNTMS